VLVVICIIAILAALLVPAIQAIRKKSLEEERQKKQEQIYYQRRVDRIRQENERMEKQEFVEEWQQVRQQELEQNIKEPTPLPLGEKEIVGVIEKAEIMEGHWFIRFKDGQLIVLDPLGPTRFVIREGKCTRIRYMEDGTITFVGFE
jgi:type II secretory pathway pseudopilin PulG